MPGRLARYGDEIKKAALECYGSPIRQFVSALINDPDWRRRVAEWRNEFRRCVRETRGDLPPEIARVESRFSLVAAAGELATAYGITGCRLGSP